MDQAVQGVDKKVKRFIFQWHINEACNLNCLHCYQGEAKAPEISEKEALEVIGQIKAFDVARHIHVNITGGEPFLHERIFDTLSLLKEDPRISTGILCNGTLISKETAKRVARAGVSFVQVSIDGKKETHDQIRGKGAFEKAVSGIAMLKKAKVDVQISFTANKMNYAEYRDVAALGRKLGVARVWSDRVIPSGAAEANEIGLSQEETGKYLKIVARENEKKSFALRKTVVQAHRALQFLQGNGSIYHCGAAKNLFAIMPGGDVYPCRRLPWKIGNIFERTLSEIFVHNEFSERPGATEVPAGCEDCFYVEACGGGLKCLSYALTGDPDRGDPGCMLLK